MARSTASNWRYLLFSLLSSSLSSVQAETANTYKLDTIYSGPSFFDGFDFFMGADPTHGFVKFVPYLEIDFLIHTDNKIVMLMSHLQVRLVSPLLKQTVPRTSVLTLPQNSIQVGLDEIV
jgi:hypothetical protein